jgi:hypothetical protein
LDLGGVLTPRSKYQQESDETSLDESLAHSFTTQSGFEPDFCFVSQADTMAAIGIALTRLPSGLVKDVELA